MAKKFLYTPDSTPAPPQELGPRRKRNFLFLPDDKPWDTQPTIPEITPQTTAEPTIGDRAKDLTINLAKSVVGTGESLVGMADLALAGGGAAAGFAPPPGQQRSTLGGLMRDYLGYDPEMLKRALEDQYSPAQKAANAAVAGAEGFTGTLGALARNPSVAVGSVVESAGPMLLGGAIGRTLPIAATAGGAIGEGLVSAGGAAAGVVQETGTLTPKQAAIVATSGAVTGLLSRVFGKLADRFGYADVDTMMADAATKPTVKQTISEATKQVARIPPAFLSEAAEETTQTLNETVASNLATGKPWDQDLGSTAAHGAVTGGLMGGGAQATRALPRRPARAPVDPADTGLPISEQTIETARRIEAQVGAASGLLTFEPFQGEDLAGETSIAPPAVPGAPVDVPVRLTDAQRVTLGQMGYPEDEIAAMSPGEALQVISDGMTRGAAEMPPLPPVYPGPEFIPVGEEPAVPPPATRPAVIPDPVPTIQAKLAAGLPVGSPEMRADFAERKRVEAERIAADIARGETPAPREAVPGTLGALVSPQAPLVSPPPPVVSPEATTVSPTTPIVPGGVDAAEKGIESGRRQSQHPKTDGGRAQAGPGRGDLAEESREEQPEEVNADERPAYYDSFTTEELRADFQAWDLSDGGSAKNQPRLDAINAQLESRGEPPITRYGTRVDNFLSAYREFLDGKRDEPQPEAFDLDADAGKTIRARAMKSRPKPKRPVNPKTGKYTDQETPAPPAAPAAKPFSEMTRDEKIAAVKAKMEGQAPAPTASREAAVPPTKPIKARAPREEQPAATDLETLLTDSKIEIAREDKGVVRAKVGTLKFGLYPAKNGTIEIRAANKTQLRTPAGTQLRKLIKEYNEGAEYRSAWDRIGEKSRAGMAKLSADELQEIHDHVAKQPPLTTYRERVGRELAQADRRAIIAEKRGSETRSLPLTEGDADPYADDDAAAAYRYLLDERANRTSPWEDRAADAGRLRDQRKRVWDDEDDATLIAAASEVMSRHPGFIKTIPLPDLRAHLERAEEILADPQDWLEDEPQDWLERFVGPAEREVLRREGQHTLGFDVHADPPPAATYDERIARYKAAIRRGEDPKPEDFGLKAPPEIQSRRKPLEPRTQEEADAARRAANKAKREAALKALNTNLKNTATSGIDPANIGLVVDIIESYIDDGFVTFKEIIRKFRKDYGRRADLDPYFEAAGELQFGQVEKVADITDEDAAPVETASATLYKAIRHAEVSLPKDNKEVKALIARVIPGADVNSNEMLNAATDAIEAYLAWSLQGPDYTDARALEQMLTRAYRTPEKMRLQQFSTPLPIAVAAVRAAQLVQSDRVLEPTAGTGNLIAPTKGMGVAAIYARELDPSRVALLNAQGWNALEGDYLRAPLEKDAYDVIITNPPWGKYSTGKYGQPIAGDFNPGDVAERFVAKNVRELRPGGRLVVVMPTTMLGVSGAPFRGFLDKHGIVRAIIKSPPKAYDTRGTSVESLLLVFDKHGKGVTLPSGARVTELDTASWDDYEAAVERIVQRAEIQTRTEEPAPAPQGGRRPAGGRPRGARSGRPGRLPGDQRDAVQPEPGDRAPDVVPDVPPGDRGRVPEPDRPTERPVRADTTDPTRGLSDEALVAYRSAERSDRFSPYRLRTSLHGVRHPRIMVEARGLAGVDYPPLDYTPSARFESIIAEGLASIEQAEQALAAVQANVQGQHGYLAADNVGVGKAREAWLTIIELMERARVQGYPLRLVLTTKNADNIANLIESELPALIGDQPPGFEIIQVADYKESRRNNPDQVLKPLPRPDYGVLVVASHNLAPFREALIEANVSGIIGDEAHLFKNQSVQIGAAWQQLHADVFARIPREQQAFTYFTATPAQSVEDYQYLYGLRLWPIDGFGDWVDMVTGEATEDQAQAVRAAAEAGGYDVKAVAQNTSDTQIGVGADAEDVATTDRGGRSRSDVFTSRLTPAEGEQVTREWKRLGRFSSRDLWREGTEFVVHTTQADNTSIARYDQFTQLARDIITAARKWGKKNKAARAGVGGVVSQLQFAAKRIQMQPALEEASRMAKEHLDQGYQVVLSIINVSGFDAEAGNVAAAIGQINIHDIDVTNDGELIDNGEIPEALQARAELMEQSAELDKLPSPIEYLEEQLGPDNIAFIIGGNVRNRENHARQFQAGERTVAVISDAGSTGISLDHRVRTTKGPGFGRRVFIDVQFVWSATQAIQRYGRVDRASQISAPKITALNFGTAAEKKFLSTIANRLASLGALSKGGSETTGTELEEFEIEGGESTAAAREAWANLPDETKEYFTGRLFRETIPGPGGTSLEYPAKRTQAQIKDIMLALLFVPTQQASDYWDAFLAERERLRALTPEGADRRTKAGRGELLRTIPLTRELTLHQVRDENNHRFGILSGVVMPEMPRIRDFLRDTDGNIRRQYTSFTAGEQVFAGLVIPWSRTSGVAKFYGRALKAEVLDTPAKVMDALKAGDVVPLDQKDANGKAWQIRLRRDQKIVVDGVKMADRALVTKHAVGYHAAGNWWEVVDLPRFLERFPVAKPKVEATPEELAAEEEGSTSDSRVADNAPAGTPGSPTFPQVGRPPTAPPPTVPPSVGAQRFNKISPLEFPELLELGRALIGDSIFVQRLRKLGALGRFRESVAGASIRLHPDLFKAGNEVQLAAVLSHEIGHAIDWLPHRHLKRGNLLGRLYSLRKHMKGTFTNANGTEIKNSVIKAELLAVSRAWSPYDVTKVSEGYRKYRESAKELYADALSALLTNPAFLQQKAPTFYEEFFGSLDQKPEVKSEYFGLLEIMSGTREELVARRLERDLEMFARGDVKAIDIQQARIDERNAVRKDIWLKFKIEMVDKNSAVYQRVAQVQKRGGVIPEASDPRYMLEERAYLGGKIKGWMERTIQPLYKALGDAQIPWDQFGLAMMYERIIDGDRSELANPTGSTPAVAQEKYEALRAGYTDEQLDVLDQALTDFRAAFSEVTEAAYQSGLYTDDQYAQIQENPKYATFQVIEYLDEGVSSSIIRQSGTLKDIANVADATILKAMVTMRATEHNNVKRSTFDFLHRHFATDIQQAREVYQGKRGMVPQEPKKSERNRLVLITYKDKGRVRGKYVDPYIASALNNESLGASNSIIRVIRFMNSRLFRPLFTTYNPGFMSFNVARDFFRFWKNVPTMTVGRAIVRYYEAAPMASARAFGLVGEDSWRVRKFGRKLIGKPESLPTPKELAAWKQVIEAEEAKIFSITFNDMAKGREPEDQQIEDIFVRSGIGDPKIRQHPLIKGLRAVLDPIEKIGNFIETLPKAAAIHEYRGNGSIADLTPAQRSHIRRAVGSPDFLAGGALKPVFNELFIFSNAITQGVRADIRVATEPQTRAGWWYKTAALNILPKAFVMAMVLGLGGDERKRLYQKISEYDLTNYLSFPIGRDERGNTVYMRLPQDDAGRLIGGLVWKGMQLARGDAEFLETLSQILDYTGGQFPGVTPTLAPLSAGKDVLTGQNPYDEFRGRNVFTDDEWKARYERPGETAGKFLGWQFQQLGGSAIWKFVPGETLPRAEGLAQRVLNFPIVSNVAGRWVKVSSYGDIERLRRVKGKVEAGEAATRLAQREEVNKAIRDYRSLQPWEQTESQRRKMARQIIDTVYPGATKLEKAERSHRLEKTLKVSIRRGEADPYADQMLSATSNAQKVVVIEEARASMTPDEFNRWYTELRKEKLISDPLHELARGK
jgi:SAM-dependent methyltransferase